MASDYFGERSFFFEYKGKLDTFIVVSFSGREALSELFEFDITLVTEDSSLKPEDMLLAEAALYLGPDKKLPFKGIISSVELMSEVDGTFYYRVILVPALWKTTLKRQNRIFQEMTISDIINKVTGEHGLSINLSLQGSPRKWTYITQYQETDFDFLSRLMERDGVYYYWDNAGALIITDSSLSHQPSKDVLGDLPQKDLTINYSPPSGLGVIETLTEVMSFISRHRPVPKKITLYDYDFRKEGLDLQGESSTQLNSASKTKMEGEIAIFGEHYRSEEISHLAKVRTEEMACRGEVYTSQSSCPMIRTGALFTIANHFHALYNQEYLVTRISHEGSQAGLFMAGGGSEESGRLHYSNTFECIPKSVQFRPARITPKPRIHGAINGKITGGSSQSGGGTKYPQIDQFGQYKVSTSYDYAGRGAKMERSSRLATPYTGPNYGFHFPLQVNSDVLLSFIEGDIDRPIITGAVWTAKNKNLLVDADCDKSRLRTYNNNFLEMADTEDGQFIYLETVPKSFKTKLNLGMKDKKKEQGIVDGYTMKTEGHSEIQIKLDSKETVEGNSTMTIHKNYTTEVKQNREDTVKQNHKHVVQQNHEQAVQGNQKRDITGDQTVKIMGKQQLEVMAGRTTKIMSKDELTVIGEQKETVQGKSSRKVEGLDETTVSAMQELTVQAGRTIKNNGFESRTNGGPLTLTRNGPVTETNNAVVSIMYQAMATIQFMAMVSITQMGTAMETNNGTLIQTRNTKIEKCNSMEMVSGSMKLKNNQMEIVTNSMTIVS